jgi:hypothetical protein
MVAAGVRPEKTSGVAERNLREADFVFRDAAAAF